MDHFPVKIGPLASSFMKSEIKDLKTERLRRNFKSLSKEKERFSAGHNSSLVYNEVKIQSQEKAVNELGKFWVKMKLKHQNKQSLPQNFSEENTNYFSKPILQKYIPVSQIDLELKRGIKATSNSDLNLKTKKHMKKIYENYSNVYQKTKTTKSPLSIDFYKGKFLLSDQNKENFDSNTQIKPQSNSFVNEANTNPKATIAHMKNLKGVFLPPTKRILLHRNN